MGHNNNIAVLMGPTGSGKSALALEIAAQRPTVIINADAMQMVGALRVITARPTEDEERQAEHALYGVLPAQQPTSVAVWLALVVPVIRAAWAEGKLPLLVGGTGMYVKTLQDGIAHIPAVPDEIKSRLRALPADEIRAQLETRDAVMAAQVKVGDSQRNLRALEVLEATGQSLSHWQAQGNARLLTEASFHHFYIAVEKEVLYPRLNIRFEKMMRAGALEEVQALVALGLADDNPILRAHGVPELAAYLRGDMTLEAAVTKAQQNTRNYAKRQQTWIRNQMKDAVAVRSAADIGATFTELN